MSLGADYALRFVRLFTDVFGGDVVQALVFIAAAQAGTQHLRHLPNYPALLEGEFFPDDQRRSVSVSALARSLGLSVETTRRHVLKLVEGGFALRTKAGGVLVTSLVLRRDEVVAVAQANAINMQALMDGLLRPPAED